MLSTKISTLSIMVGDPSCNLRCPYCISKTTYRVKAPTKTPVSPERIAFLVDKFRLVAAGIPYGIITGKGEPTLVTKEEMGLVISLLYNNGRGLVPELQTNGLRLNRENMAFWKEKGLNTVAISCVSPWDEANSRLLADNRTSWNLGSIVSQAKEIGLLVRLTVTMTKGGIDSPDSFLAFMKWAKEAGAKQVTFREMGKPRQPELKGAQKVIEWIDQHHVETGFLLEILRVRGKEQAPLPWGYKFNYDGVSVVVAECLTPPKDGEIRSGIIQPDGHMYGSWDDPADILI
ncbi:MAG: radical SAM protein [Candidatus Margulisiibacteriota bacterium]